MNSAVVAVDRSESGVPAAASRRHRQPVALHADAQRRGWNRDDADRFHHRRNAVSPSQIASLFRSATIPAGGSISATLWTRFPGGAEECRVRVYGRRMPAGRVAQHPVSIPFAGIQAGDGRDQPEQCGAGPARSTRPA